MGNNLQFNLFEQEKMTARERWLDQLTNFVIVDMGIISSPSVTQQGYRCRVKPFRLSAGQQVVYDGVEVIMPGNSIGGIDFDLNGASCIVFGPYSSAVAVNERGILGSNKPYDFKYLKCMPVGNPATWKGKLQFDGNGSCIYKTVDAMFQFGVDGSLLFWQNTPQQQLTADANGVITWQTPTFTSTYYPDGSYYKYSSGVEPGSFTKLESFIDNIEDTFETTIDTFEEEDSDVSLWDQLLAFNKWARRYSYNRTTGEWHKYIRAEAGVFDYYESFVGGIHDTYWSTLEDVEEEDGDEADKWTQLDGATWRKHKQHDTNTGTEFMEQYDADGNLLSREDFNPDGSRLLVNTDSDGVNLFTRLIDADGALTIEIGDGKYKLEVAADGTVTEHQESDKEITTAGNLTIKADGDGAIETGGTFDITSGGNSTVNVTGNCDIEASGNLSFKSSANGMLEIGNTVNTLGKFLDTIYTNLMSLHTEGSPAAHTGSAWAASWVTAEKTKLGMVFK